MPYASFHNGRIEWLQERPEFILKCLPFAKGVLILTLNRMIKEVKAKASAAAERVSR